MESIEMLNALRRAKSLAAAIADETTGNIRNMAEMVQVLIHVATEYANATPGRGPEADLYIEGYSQALDDLADYFTHAQERERRHAD